VCCLLILGIYVSFFKETVYSHHGYYNIMRNSNATYVFTSACRGSVKTLNASDGIIIIDRTEYIDYMNCLWKIKVDPAKVIRITVTRIINILKLIMSVYTNDMFVLVITWQIYNVYQMACHSY